MSTEALALRDELPPPKPALRHILPVHVMVAEVKLVWVVADSVLVVVSPVSVVLISEPLVCAVALGMEVKVLVLIVLSDV